MADITNLWLFILAGWLLNLTPGPDVLYIVSNALRSGAKAGVVAAMGITAGCFVHVLAAAAGLSALLAASSTAFTVLKWVGAAYLFWVGVKLLRSRPDGDSKWVAEHSVAGRVAPLRTVFFKGFLTNVLNPKVALFFLAFMPQFIAPGAAHPAWTFVLLGVLFNVNALPINVGYAWLAAWASGRMGLVQRGMQRLDRLAGMLFVGFGLRLALADSPVR